MKYLALKLTYWLKALIIVILFMLPSLVAAQGTTQYTYDNNGRLSTVTLPTGEKAIYSYDPAGNITSIQRVVGAAPQLTSFSPQTGFVGDTITFAGINLGSVVSVSFNGTLAQVTAANINQISAIVPANATNGPITLTLSNGTLTTGNFSLLRLQVLPPQALLNLNQTQAFLTIIPPQLGSNAVQWTVNGIVGGNNEVGTIDSNGFYTAPLALLNNQPQLQVAVRATSVLRNTIFGQAQVTITTANLLTVNPVIFSLSLSQTKQFSATYNPPTNVSWAVNGVTGGNSSLGTITSDGFYTAPTQLTGGQTVLDLTIRATSTTDNTLFGEAQGSVSLAGLTLTPTLAKVAPNTTQQFTTNFTNFSGDQSVTWSVNGLGGGSNQFGTITPAGVYVAPDLPANIPVFSVIIRATNNSQPTLFSEAKVIIANNSITISPATATLDPLQLQQFTATYANFNGLPAPANVWSVNGIVGGNSDIGTISSFGQFNEFAQYIAPNELAAGQTQLNVTIRATNVFFPDLYGEAQVIGRYHAFLLIDPVNVVKETNQTQQFTANFHNFGPDRRVTWTLIDLSGGNNDIGTITADGLYTAPAQVTGNFNLEVGVRATSVADPTLSFSTQITILPTSLRIMPGGVSLDFNQTQQFSTVFTSYTGDQSVIWSVDDIVGGNSEVGTIDANGLYTAPAQLPPGQTSASFLIKATSVAIPTLAGITQVTVPQGGISAIPPTLVSEK